MAKKPLRSIAPKDTKFDLKGVKKSSIEAGSTGEDPGVDYEPKDEMGQKFVAAHKTEKHADRVGNTKEPYTGNPEHYDLNSKKEKRHGYMSGADKKVYEAKGMKCETCSKEECECGAKKKLLLGGKKGLAEVLTKNTPTKKVIDDFVHSDAPNFKNKSKEERIKMALGAKYSMMRKENFDDNSPLARGQADEHYGRPVNPHKQVPDANGNLQKVKLTDPKEIDQYMAGRKNNPAGKKVYEDLAMPMLEGGKKKKTTKLEKESSDTTTSYPSGGVGDTGRV